MFLPAAGYAAGYVDDQGNYGYYWSSTPDGSYGAYVLRSNSGSRCVTNYYRLYGYSVRAVLAE